MKRTRTLCILLTLCLLVSLFSQPVAAQTSFFFVAVDDAIPLTLEAGPHSAATGLYMPYTVFDAAPGGVVPAYNVNENTLVLFNRSQRLVFNLSKETVTDENGASQTVLTTYRNGLLYIPISLCAAHFGLSYSLLSSKDGYPVLRFTTGAEVYDDSLFIEKAESLISLRVSQAQTPAPEPPPPVEPKPPAEQQPEPPVEEKPTDPGSVYLAVTNASTMAEAAALLTEQGLPAAFFLTAAEIQARPELVRTLYAAGFLIGLTVEPEETDALSALRKANDALDGVLNTRSLMALLAPAQLDGIDSFCVFVRSEEFPDAQAVIEAQAQDLLLPCGEEAAETVAALQEAGVTFRQLRETTILEAEDAPEEAAEEIAPQDP